MPSNQPILDAPEEEAQQRLRFSFSLILQTCLLLFIGFLLLFWLIQKGILLEVPTFRMLYFNFDITLVLFLAIISFILYFFVARLNYSAKDWYRIMVVSVSMVFFTMVSAAIILSFDLVIFNLWNSMKLLSFMSVVAGGGSSISVQLLRRQQYAFFVLSMIITLTLFALVNYI